MTSDRGGTGAVAIFNQLSPAEEGLEWRLVRLVVDYFGWLFVLFVAIIHLISTGFKRGDPAVYGWVGIALLYQGLLLWLSKKRPQIYETDFFRMVRLQIMLFFGSALILLSGGAGSYFWFVYLWGLFASALYFSWRESWIVYAEVVLLYFLASFLAVGELTALDWALWLTNLLFLLVLAVVLRYLMESLRKQREAESALRYFSWLRETQQDVDAAMGLQEVLKRILDRAIGLVGAGDGSLMLLEEDGGLHFRARFRGPHPPEKRDRTFKPGDPDEGIAGWVVRNERPYLCQDTSTDKKFTSILAGEPIGSLIAAPIISHGTVLGVINVDYPAPNRFSEEDATILVNMASQVAVAIERAELLEGLEKVAQAALGQGRDLNQKIVQVVHRLTRCPVVLWRVDQDGERASIVAADGMRQESGSAEIDLAGSVTGRAMRERRIIQVPDIQSERDFRRKDVALDEGWQSMLSVPLFAGGRRAIGALSIYSTAKRESFSQWEIAVLRTFSGQAGMVIQRMEELEILREIGRAASSLGVEGIARLVYDKTSQLMDTTNFFLCLYNAEEQILDFKIWMYNNEPLEMFSCPVSGLTAWVVQRKESLLIEDWDQQQDELAVETDIITERQRSWLGVPMLVGGEVLGVLNVQSPEPGAFTSETQSLLETVASQAAFAIQNARQLEREQALRHQADTLREVAAAISDARSLNEVTGRILDGLAAVVGYKKASMQLVQGNERSLVDHRGYPPEEVAQWLLRPISEDKLVQRIVASGRPLILPDPTLDEDWEVLPETEDVRSWVGLPLVYAEDVIGLLTLDHDQSGYYDESCRDLLVAFGYQAAIAIHKTNLLEQTRQRAEILKLLQEASSQISATLDVAETMRLIVRGALSLTGTDTGVIHLINEAGTDILRSYEYPEGFDHPPARFAQGTGLTRNIYTSGKILEVTDVSKFELAGRMTEKDVISNIGVPLKLGDDVIGVLFLNSFRLHLFSEQEKEMLTMLAEQAALAIDKARRYSRRVQDIAALQEINSAISSKELEEIFALIAQKATELTDGTYGTLWKLDSEHQCLRIGAVFGRDPLEETLPLDESSINGCVALRRKPYLSNNVREDEHYHSWFDDIESNLTVPLLFGADLIGTLHVESTRLDAFTVEQQELLQSLGDQAAIAIRNAELYAEKEEYTSRLERLQQVTTEISSSIFDLKQVGQSITDSLSTIFQNAHCDIMLYDQELDVFTRLAYTGDPNLATLSPRPDGISRHIVQMQQPYYVEDTAATLASDRRPVREQVVALKVRSFAYLPLLYEAKTLGVLYLNSFVQRAFSPSDRRILELFADQAAIAIQTARLYAEMAHLYRERVRDMAALQAINDAVVEQEHGEILQLVVQKAVEVMPGEYGELWLKEPATGDLILEAAWGPDSDRAREQGRLKAGVTSINAQVAQSGEPHNCPDVSKEEAFFPIYRAAKSSLTVPLVYHDAVMGTLNVESDRLGAFGGEHEKLLDSFADQAAIAIRNARLVKNLRAVERVARDLTSAIDLGEADILDEIYEQAGEVMHTDNMYIALYEQESDTVRFPLMYVGKESKPVPPRSRGGGRTEWIIEHREPLLIRTREESEQWYQEPGRKEYIQQPFASWLGVPMAIGDKVLGVIAVYHETADDVYDEDDELVLSLMAGQAAIALENIRLFSEERQRVRELDKLRELAEELGSGAL